SYSPERTGYQKETSDVPQVDPRWCSRSQHRRTARPDKFIQPGSDRVAHPVWTARLLLGRLSRLAGDKGRPKVARVDSRPTARGRRTVLRRLQDRFDRTRA